MRKATSAGAALLVLLFAGSAAGAQDARALGRSAGGDRTTAVRVAQALLTQPLALQLTRVRCERVNATGFCGLTLSGVKFHRRVDTASFRAEVDGLVRAAFAVDPAIAEVDLWVTVPLAAGKGAVVSGDFAMPSSATVFAVTVPRSGARGEFWDPAFRSELERGSAG